MCSGSYPRAQHRLPSASGGTSEQRGSPLQPPGHAAQHGRAAPPPAPAPLTHGVRQGDTARPLLSQGLPHAARRLPAPAPARAAAPRRLRAAAEAAAGPGAGPEPGGGRAGASLWGPGGVVGFVRRPKSHPGVRGLSWGTPRRAGLVRYGDRFGPVRSPPRES